MTVESVIQTALIDLSGVELTLEHIAELTLAMASKMKTQAGMSLSQKIEAVKSALRTFVLTHTVQVSDSTKKLLSAIDTHVGETVAAELKEPFLRRVMNSVYGLFWPSVVTCSKPVSDCSGTPVSDCSGTPVNDCSGSAPVVIPDETEVDKKSCSISCCSKNMQVEEPLFTTLVEAVVESVVEPVAEAVEPVVEAVKTYAWCQPKKNKKKAKKNGLEAAKELEVDAAKELEVEAAKELEVEAAKELEVDAVKEPE